MSPHRYSLLLMAFVIILAWPVPIGADAGIDLEGSYFILGWNPGNPPQSPPDYDGTAVLTRWGHTWRYHGFMDDMTYAGAGLFDPKAETLSLSFINGDGSERGVTLLHTTASGFKGIWAMDNGGSGDLGYEIWTKEK